MLLLTSKGAAGVAGAAFVVLAATLSAHRHDPGRQRRPGSRHPSADVAGPDADQFDRQRRGDDLSWRNGKMHWMKPSCTGCSMESRYHLSTFERRTIRTKPAAASRQAIEAVAGFGLPEQVGIAHMGLQHVHALVPQPWAARLFLKAVNSSCDRRQIELHRL